MADVANRTGKSETQIYMNSSSLLLGMRLKVSVGERPSGWMDTTAS